MSSTRLSVVIPTRNREWELERCLAAVLNQTDTKLDEVLVVDDRSQDGTRALLAQHPSVTVIDGSGVGASAARNLAVSRASGGIVLFVDDDIVLCDGAVARHVEFHTDHPATEDALIGLVTWDPRRPITRHMIWLEDGGPLFSFNTIVSRDGVDPRHFCTANASVKRTLLERVDGPFEERIRRFTDVELGQRLTAQGMNLHYDPDLVGWHLRFDTPATTDERMFEVGRASVMLDTLHPGVAPQAAPVTALRRMKAGAARALEPATGLMPDRLAGKVWETRAAWAYGLGRRDAGLDQ